MSLNSYLSPTKKDLFYVIEEFMPRDGAEGNVQKFLTVEKDHIITRVLYVSEGKY